jgi:hypothetical protein
MQRMSRVGWGDAETMSMEMLMSIGILILSGLIIVWAGFTLGWAAMKLFFVLRHHRPFPRGWR